MVEDLKAATRPILSILSFFALFIFYMLKVFGYDIPPEVHGFWVPFNYYFIARQIEKAKGKA